MGKTETARMFARLGVPVYDADAVVHALYETGGGAVDAIAAAFPGAVKEGRVDRLELAGQVGGDEEAFRRLEAIVHPLAAKAQQDFLADAIARNEPMVVLDIPLLFETGADARMDAVVVVSAPAEVQRVRVLSRHGMTPERLDNILARQLPDAEKRAKAQFVVETGKGLNQAFEQVKAIVAQLRKKHA
ncbi:MAG: dephospho-CoA kinase [Alphaproteobacteria bacterium]|nr:dephospho-CoA kinase [Alphaproteobacteria bacterium]